ncbi:aromatic/alkene monooxygenase hydroxylase subunit beta [Pseudomonas stutzeri]|uniref:aromatic/alkene monooxygenase hydroxylase subunit beta n=1 Tax=Stutzerimonas stutzeri TaxID=316 RepID=UPI001DAACDCF|nr:aromatic/alkene monooxygenase hydroxylase subunit beta [Stutzerimonas stutzeri]MBW8454454.1 aromatic/alkene monooxygenase hydroxylase subunit beta [Pseudomonas sp.]MCC8342466.1 aromatic/alkene monooxygenase hydroxylase subunit beta [Stutzerimonas stutzeri]
MSVEIKTNTVETLRHTYGNLQRRFGDKPASRYQEASYDIEATTNFHYRPLWDPQRQLNDPSRTAIRMADWHAVTDPRQYFYGAYVQARARMQEATEHAYGFCEKRGLLSRLPEALQHKILRCLVPLRHAEMGANMNNSGIAGDCIAGTMTQLHIYQAMDRLGIGQYLSRIGLLLGEGSGSALDQAKAYWMDDPIWQGLRRYVEDSLVIKDWFELTLAQNLLLDGMSYPLMYQRFDQQLGEEGAADLSMLTEFMRDWYAESTRWVDAMLKVVLAESADNHAQIQTWVDAWEPRAYAALQPLAEAATGLAALDDVRAALAARLHKLGLRSPGVPA